jgi:hypothetical protein
MDNRVGSSNSEDISPACFVPLQKKCIAMHIHVLGTGKLISKSGFFPLTSVS